MLASSDPSTTFSLKEPIIGEDWAKARFSYRRISAILRFALVCTVEALSDYARVFGNSKEPRESPQIANVYVYTTISSSEPKYPYMHSRFLQMCSPLISNHIIKQNYRMDICLTTMARQ